MSLLAHLEPMPEPALLEPRWRLLEQRAAPDSFFLTWTWIGSWLEASGARPSLLSVRDGSRDVALALLGRSADKRLFGRVPTLHLNEAGDRDADRPFIEYNGLLCAPRDARPAAHAMMAVLSEQGEWRALRLSGVLPGAPLLQSEGIVRRILRDEMPACFIDLEAVRDAGGDYLSLLGSNTRSQIRRSFKDHGAAEIAAAQDDAQTTQWLDDMARLNAGRHADNAWDHAGFRRFAETICQRGRAPGTVELLRISCGSALTGYLLNFLWNGVAMNYQSAFVEPAGPKSKPGLMCHAAAVTRYAAAGLSRYSLLAGRDRYKQNLATGAETLQWWTLERPSLRLAAEALARRLLKR